jgi:methionyl-tRNA formyltransferase
MMAPRLIFAGTPEFAATILAALLDAGHGVVAVYTQPDRPAGRGRQLRASPVKALSLARAIPVAQPRGLSDEATLAALESWQADLMVVAAYGLLLPETVLSTPRLGCVNVHASLLPRWRGAAPIAHAILAGDQETGVSIMRMDQGLDTGPVYRRAACPMDARDTAASLHDRLATLGARTLVEVLPDLLAGTLEARNQDHSAATYAPRLSKQDGLLDWNTPAEALERRVRAFDPWPVAYTVLDPGPGETADPRASRRLRIWHSEAMPMDSASPPGTIVASSSAGIHVATGKGTLRILGLQAPGSRMMTVAEYLNAHRLPVGMRLGGATAEPA